MEHVNCPLSEHARCIPEQIALESSEGTLSYQELDLRVSALCDFLKTLGIDENKRVAFVAHSLPATVLLFFALFRLRAIACPLSFRIPQEQLPMYFQLLKPSHILDPTSLRQSSAKCYSQPLTQSSHQLATFLFTSGSSGTPKIACHSFGNHYYNAMGVIPALGLELSSRWLLSLPLFHVSGIGILFRCFLRGATVVLTPQMNLEKISQLNISHLSLVPTHLYRLLKLPAERLDKIKTSLKCVLLGGAPLPPSLLRAAYATGLPLLTTYGMTEMSSIITLNSEQQLPFRSLKIAEDQQIWVSGKTLFKGYWNAACEKIVRADQEGWFPTNDLGKLTDHLEIFGRKDRQFISGGENIQPEEIERALCSLPGIRQASVLPIEDDEFGERPIAFIDDETGSYTLSSLRQSLQDRLPSFMHPIQLFPYPTQLGIKPSLGALKLYLDLIRN